MEPPFPRTTCACHDCVNCCKTQPGPLVPGDLQRIAGYMGVTVQEAKLNFVASPGATVRIIGITDPVQIPSITPKYDEKTKRCVFLDKRDRCSIHAVAPAGCAYFDTHMSWAEGQFRGKWMAAAQMDDAYQQLRDTLPLTTHYKPRRY